LVEQNQPIDITKDMVYFHQEQIENGLSGFPYSGKRYDLSDLIRQIDMKEPKIMSNVETETYLAIREGMQIFKTVSDMLEDKTGARKKLLSTKNADLATDPELLKLNEFCHNFAAYAASAYIVKKIETALMKDPEYNAEKAKDEKPMGLDNLQLNASKPAEGVITQLVAPIYANLVNHVEGKKDVFKAKHEFPLYVKDVFEKYASIAKSKKDAHPTLDRHINGYRWRIMDDFLSIESYEDKSVPTVKPAEQKLSFRPIRSEEIVGNKSAKRKISRYVDRLVLYDFAAKKNPIIDMGGLAWTVLFDGPPGTGKSSLFRLAMTLLDERCQQLGIKYNVFTVDQSIKDEYYGKTGKILLERLAVTKDQNALSLGIFDDLDLLTTTRREAQGADNDINNIIMQYLDGVYTLRLGNVINFGATNKPTGLDDALRNRFNDRFLIDGPVSAEDFADIVNLELKQLIKIGKLKIDNGKGYKPFDTQDIRNDDGTWTAHEDVAAYMAENLKQYKNATLIDFGRFMEGLKAKNQKITGRSAKAINESIKARCANFDIPNDWFADRRQFLDLPFEKKVQAIGKLYVPITPDILFQEAQRYFDSEERYANNEAVEQIGRSYDNKVWNIQSEIRLLEEQVKQAKEGGKVPDLARLEALRTQMAIIQETSKQTVIDAFKRAEDEDRKGRK